MKLTSVITTLPTLFANTKNGYIEKECFKNLFQLPNLSDIPFVLETPSDEGITHQEEISMLYQFIQT